MMKYKSLQEATEAYVAGDMTQAEYFAAINRFTGRQKIRAEEALAKLRGERVG